VHSTSSVARTEADIYTIDKLVKKYLLSECPVVDLLHDEPFAIFFADTSITPWQRLDRLLRLAGQLGPDNTHPEEYVRILKVLNAALDQLLQEGPWSEPVATQLTNFFLENCDRLLFNATPQGISRFFNNPKRREFEVLIDKLAAGSVLSEEDLLVFEPYTQSLAADIEYHLSHALFILSSFND